MTMKTKRLIVVLSVFMIVLTGCSNQQLFSSENNQIIETTYEEVTKETGKYFVIIGKKDDKYTAGLSNHLKNVVRINDEKIFLVYLDNTGNEINSIFSVKKVPTLYVLENGQILDSIEYLNDEDTEGMDSLGYTKFLSSVKNKINEFVEKYIK